MQANYEPWRTVKDGKDYWGFRVLDGKFTDLIMSINDVRMATDDTVTLDYDVVYSLVPQEELEKDPDFNEVVSFIIQDILIKAMNEYENRERNSEQSSNG